MCVCVFFDSHSSFFLCQNNDTTVRVRSQSTGATVFHSPDTSSLATPSPPPLIPDSQWLDESDSPVVQPVDNAQHLTKNRRHDHIRKEQPKRRVNTSQHLPKLMNSEGSGATDSLTHMAIIQKTVQRLGRTSELCECSSLTEYLCRLKPEYTASQQFCVLYSPFDITHLTLCLSLQNDDSASFSTLFQ